MRKQAGQPSRQHRLARAGRSHEQQVVIAGRGDFEGEPGNRLSAHVGEIGRGRRRRRIGQRRRRGPRLHADERIEQLGERRREEHLAPGHQRRFVTGARSNDHRVAGESVDQGQHARDRSYGAVEAELGDEGEAFDYCGRQGLGGDEQPDGDGEVEPGADLAETGWREVDGDPLVRPPDARRRRARARTGRATSRHAVSGRPTIVKLGRPTAT